MLSGVPARPYKAREWVPPVLLISLSKFSAVGTLMGGMKLEGHLARYFNMSLYHMHQIALYGVVRTTLSLIGGFLRNRIKPALKLH